MTTENTNLETGKIYDLTPITHLLPDTYKTVMIIGKVNYDIAMNYTDVNTRHFNIYTGLPEGTPKSPQDYNYYLIKRTVGSDTSIEAVGVPWISSAALITNARYTVTINSCPEEDGEQYIRRAMNAFGMTDIEIKRITG